MKTMKTHIWSLFLVFGLISGPQFIQAEESAEPVTLKGYFFKRPDDSFLHVEMVGVRMEFKLLDKEYHDIENVFTRGIMTVDPKGDNDIRMVIRPTGDGFSLKGVKNIRKPHILKVNARLYKGEDDSTGETFNFMYNQHTVEEVTVTPVAKE